MERTVRCSRTVRFLVMFGRFEVRFLAKIRCSDMFEVRFWRFWKKLGPFFINKVREQFGFWWCSRGSKFGFGPKWDVRMCSKFDPLRFGMFKVQFFDVRSTSTLIQVMMSCVWKIFSVHNCVGWHTIYINWSQKRQNLMPHSLAFTEEKFYSTIY